MPIPVTPDKGRLFPVNHKAVEVECQTATFMKNIFLCVLNLGLSRLKQIKDVK